MLILLTSPKTFRCRYRRSNRICSKIEEFSINSRDNTRVVAEASVSQLRAVHRISDEAQVLTILSEVIRCYEYVCSESNKEASS